MKFDMKKVKSELNDWLRPEYKRSDFGTLARGKYARRVRASTNVGKKGTHGKN